MSLPSTSQLSVQYIYIYLFIYIYIYIYSINSNKYTGNVESADRTQSKEISKIVDISNKYEVESNTYSTDMDGERRKKVT